MVVTGLHLGDELGHQLTNDRRVLELRARGADRHVETGKIGSIVDGQPVVGDIVEIDDTLLPSGNRQLGHALAGAHDLSFPLVCETLIVVVRVHPLVGVALWVNGADQEMVSNLGSRIKARVAIGENHALELEVDTFWRRNMTHLLLEGARCDLHARLDIGESIDLKGVRAGHVDDHRCQDLAPVGQPDACNPVGALEDLHNLGVEEKGAAPDLTGALEIVASQLRIIDVARLRDIDGAGDRVVGRLTEARVGSTHRRSVSPGIHEGHEL